MRLLTLLGAVVLSAPAVADDSVFDVDDEDPGTSQGIHATGPETAFVGELVRLVDESDVERYATRWVIPPELDGKWTATPDGIAFATREPGIYRFVLYGVGPEEELSHRFVEVEILEEELKPTPDEAPNDTTLAAQALDVEAPQTPQDATGGPPAFYAELRFLASLLADRRSDDTTREWLGSELSKRVGTIPEDDLQLAQDRIGELFAKFRTDAHKSNDEWFTDFYVPILRRVKQLADGGKISTGGDYADAFSAVVEGLKQEPQ